MHRHKETKRKTPDSSTSESSQSSEESLVSPPAAGSPVAQERG